MDFGLIYERGPLGSSATKRGPTSQQVARCLQTKRVEIAVFTRKDPLMGTQFIAVGKGELKCNCLTKNWLSGELEHLDGTPYSYEESDDAPTISEGSVASGKYKIRYVQNTDCCECAHFYISDEPGNVSGWRMHHWCRCKEGDTPVVNFRETGPWTEGTSGEIETLAIRAMDQLSDCLDCGDSPPSGP